MDPISQGVLGASLPQAVARPDKIRTFTLLGCLAGMSPDLDVLIQSPTDPMLFLEFHRQFTHALVFIPIGALICALLFGGFVRHRLSFRETYLACLLGYGTHGLLDACTTYGTQLLWPFADTRIAWNNVSVVDPVLTLPALALVWLAVANKRALFARMALAWILGYLLLGVVQRERAEAIGYQLAAERGHTPVRLEAKAGFGNLVLWKIVYETEREFHIDAVRLLVTPKVFPGERTKRLVVAEDLPWLDPDSQQAVDLARFDWFSNRYLAIDKHDPDFVIDIRYSVVPNQIAPLWGIVLDRNAGADQHVRYIADRAGSAARVAELKKMLLQ